MKHSYLLGIVLLTCMHLNVFGQTGFPYQAVMRNSDGALVADKAIQVRYSIHQATADGTVVYREQHSVQTDADGLFSLEIGKGSAETGNFSIIDWQAGPYFIRTEVDHGSGYTLSGVQQLASLPYTEQAETAGGIQTLTADGSKKWQLTIDDNGTMQVVPIPKGYGRLVFQEEFNYTGLPDPNKWGYEVGWIRPGNKEMQYYPEARIENTFVQDGYLTIRCINNDTLRDEQGNVLNKFPLNGTDYYITSGSIRTKNKGDWKYCRVEVRVKLPPGSGTWPAIWMMPTDNVYGYWPYSGEIDIMEYIGNMPYQYNCALHYHDGEKKTAVGGNMQDPLAISDWHVFALEWEENQIRWYADGRMFYRTNKPAGASPSTWPFNQRFYLILTFTFGGVWGGQAGFNVDLLPLDYLIDYVRVYQ